MRVNLSFGVKLLIGTVSLVLLTVLIMGVINYFQVKRSLEDLGLAMIHSTGEQLISSFEMQNKVVQEKVSADLMFMEGLLDDFGTLRQNPARTADMTITNQVSKVSEQVTIPTLVAGTLPITNNFTIVDQVQKTMGGTATIFQVLPGKLLRVSTNVLKLDGERAVGTYIPEDSPVYQTVMRGETYRGRAFVVNAWYLTAYKPMVDDEGEITAVIYVGRKILTPELEQLVRETTAANKGYAFVFNGAGDILVHPSAEMLQKNIKDFPFGQDFLATKSFEEGEGAVGYELNGVSRVAYLHYFEPWDWHVGLAMTSKEMLHGLDDRVLSGGIMAGGGALALAIVLSILLAAVMVRPLKSMTTTAERIRQGDLSARMTVAGRDEIGKLSAGFNQVLDTIQAAMTENAGYVNMLNAVDDPIYSVDGQGRILAANHATARLTGQAQADLDGMACQDAFAGLTQDPDALARLCSVGAGRGGQGLITCQVKDRETTFEIAQMDMHDQNGNHLGYVRVAKDVTELAAKERQVQENLRRIEAVNLEINEVGGVISDRLAELSSQVQQVRSGADLQAQRATETATAMEQMNATVIEVARNASEAALSADQTKNKAREGVDAVTRSVDSITHVQQQVLALKTNMATLGTHAESIGQIIGVITDIADQTNLLALNAAIEAARAGDAGRGFAVVADEVRKLAEKTMAATKQVEAAVADIQNGTRGAISATEQTAEDIQESTAMAQASGERLQEILTLVETTTAQVSSIATAAEEQSATSEEISRAVDEVSRISSETAQGMSASLGAVEDVGQQAQRLRELSGA